MLFWHVREGHCGDIKLDNLSFVKVGRWEGDLWARNATGVASLYIDDHADNRGAQRLADRLGHEGKTRLEPHDLLEGRAVLIRSGEITFERQVDTARVEARRLFITRSVP